MVEQTKARELLARQLRADTADLMLRGLGGPMVDMAAALRAITTALEAGRAEEGEAILKLVEEHVQRARDTIAECEKWSPVQAEWSRARDLALGIQEAIERGEHIAKGEGRSG